MDDELRATAERLQRVCVEQALTVALAESCTGGLVAHAITEVPGSSAYFRGGVVAYANEAKETLLGVDGAVLDAHGAVSAQVARAMAEGARARFEVDLAAATTGVAGPDGGTPAKPVGLVYVAVADTDQVELRRLQLTGDRGANKRDSALAALELLVERAEARIVGRASA